MNTTAVMQYVDAHPVAEAVADRRLAQRAVVDRLHQLRVILPAMAAETAAARREAARLRRENAELGRRLAELEERLQRERL
jgi:hypothetical protein